MSHPNQLGQSAVMILDVNHVRPASSAIAQFWGKVDQSNSNLFDGDQFNSYPPDRTCFPRLTIKFDTDSEDWRIDVYKAFVESVKPNFPGDLWKYLGSVSCFKSRLLLNFLRDVESDQALKRDWQILL
jgi:hypothetical protein